MRINMTAVAATLALLGCSSSSVSTPDMSWPDASSLQQQVGDFELVATAPGRTEGIAFGKDPSGETVLYVGAADALWRVLPDRTVHKVADVPSPVGIAVRADGDILVCGKGVVNGKRTAVIWRVTPAGATSILVGAGGAFEYKLTNFVAVAPDNRLVFSDSAADKLYMAEADGTGVKLVTDQISYTNGLAFSPDGKFLLVASWDGRTVYQLPRQADGYGAPVPFTTDIAFVDGIATLASGAYLFITLDGVYRVAQDRSHRLLAKVPDTVLANGAVGRGTYGEEWMYLSNLLSGDLYRIYLGEPGVPLPAR
jgi:sugar lactone lactonase YvrE